MTPVPAASPEQRAFQAAVRANLRQRGRLLAAASGALLQRLRDAAAAIAAMLAEQPADWREWHLGEIQGQLGALIDGMTADTTAQLEETLAGGWQLGVQLVDAPLAAASIHVGHLLPVVDTSMLVALQSFTAGRIKNVGAEALGKIDSAIGLVVLGAQTPNEAMQTVRSQLGTKTEGSQARARRIVRTAVSQAYSTGTQTRMAATKAVLPELQKQWLRSGKIHSRWNHDAADGQVVDADKPFRLQTKQAGGFVELMHPHDPKAPAEEVIECGCTSRPWLARWGLPPGGTAFSEREILLNPMKAAGKGWLMGGQ